MIAGVKNESPYFRERVFSPEISLPWQPQRDKGRQPMIERNAKMSANPNPNRKFPRPMGNLPALPKNKRTDEKSFFGSPKKYPNQVNIAR
jgi:hypothetical protein